MFGLDATIPAFSMLLNGFRKTALSAKGSAELDLGSSWVAELFKSIRDNGGLLEAIYVRQMGESRGQIVGAAT